MAENQGNETGKGAKRQRRQFSAVEKRRLLDETEKPGESVSTVARRYSLSPSMLFAWRKAMEAGAATGLHAEEQLVPASEVKQLKAQSASTQIMRRNKLLLERSTGDGRGRKHDGVIVTLKPDLRWCSDSFEIRC
jgi:transposase-like protein